MGIWEGMDKEKILKSITSVTVVFPPLCLEPESMPHASNNFIHTMHKRFSGRDGHGQAGNYLSQGSTVAKNSVLCLRERCKQPLEETSAAIPTTLRPRSISQPMLYTKADTVSERENDWPIVQRHANAKCPLLAEANPEDGCWTFDHHNQISPAISPDTIPSLPKLEPDAFRGWCGSFRTSFKPSEGVVSCDICFTPYQPTSSTLPGWDLGQLRSTDQSFHPAGELDALQDDSTNHAAWPDVTTSSSYGNDIDDFSWFMAS